VTVRIARAPGRVNLIGEHTDYNHLPVLPIALDREVVIRFTPRADARVLLTNTNPLFPPVAFDLGPAIPAEPGGAWGNYARAAGQGLWAELGPLRGIEGEVGSTVPVAAGLSSSSALVVATALALLDANGRTMEPIALMDLLARAERYVGLEGGGMDQAISLGGRAGHALRIDFAPLRLTPVAVPADWRFVVADTLVRAEKSAAARDAYNTRVAQCREALARFRAANPDVPCDSYAELLTALSAENATTRAASTLDGVLLKRFRHVVSEGARVTEAVAALREENSVTFGRLMRASHRSLRDDYEVSCPELEELVSQAEKAGAAGARLTGAGFGGSIVALTTAGRADGMIGALASGYYRPRGIPDAVGRHVFVAIPGAGARVGTQDSGLRTQ
jgi:galactokinase